MPPSPQKNTGNHHIKATITEILHKGSKTAPFRAMIEMSGNNHVILTSKTPLPVKVGDDIKAEGVLIKADDYQLPDNFYILEPHSPEERLEAIAQNGAEIRNFAEPDTPRPNRPAHTAIKHGLKGSFATEIIHEHCSLIRHNTIENPIIEWAASLFDGLQDDRLTMIIDREKVGADIMTSSPSKIHDLNWISEASFQHKSKSPAMMAKHLGENDVQSFAQSAGNYITWGQGKHLPYNKTLSILIPFHPHHNAATFIVGLSYNFINGRDTAFATEISTEQSQAFAATHELAHSVQNAYIEGCDESKNNMYPAKAGAQTLFQEINADAFAFLALLQRYDNIGFLRNIAGLRHAGLLAGGFDHATGLAMDALLDKAETWQKNGTLAKMKPAEMLQIAADHAKKYKLNLKDYTALRDASFNLHNGFDKDSTKYNIDDIQKMQSRCKNIKNEMAQRYYNTALKRMNGLAFDQKALKDPQNQAKAQNIYKNNLSKMIADSGENLTRAEAIIKNAKNRLARADKENKSQNIFVQNCHKIIEELSKKLPTPTAPIPQEKAPWRVVQITDTPSSRAAYFEIAPAKRLEIYKDLLRDEAQIIKNITDASPLSPDEIYQLGRIGAKQHDVAFALRAEENTWQKVKKMAHEPLQKNITTAAKRFFTPHSYNRGDHYYIQHRKETIATLLKAAPKITAKPSVKPKL